MARVIVTPNNPTVDGEPFIGTTVDDFDFDHVYVRTPEGELTGPWEPSEITPI